MPVLPLRRPPKMRPLASVPPNLASTYGRGLNSLFVFNESGGGPGRELVTGRRPVQTAGTPFDWTTRPLGRVPVWPAAQRKVTNTLNHSIASATFSLYVDFTTDVTTTMTPVSIGTTGSLDQLLHIKVSSTGYEINFWSDDWIGLSATNTPGVRLGLLISFDAPTKTMSAWHIAADAPTIGSFGTRGFGNVFLGSSVICFGGRTIDANDVFRGSLNLVAVWDRKLGAADLAALFGDPYQVLALPAWTNYLLFGGGLRFVPLSVAGTVTPTGDLLRTINKPGLAGTVTPTGSLAILKAAILVISGAVTPAGALVKQAGKVLAGVVTPVGTLVKSAGRHMTGTVTPSGTLAVLRVTLLNLAGSVTPVGAMLRTVVKFFEGLVTPTGEMTQPPRATPPGRGTTIQTSHDAPQTTIETEFQSPPGS